MASSFSAGDIFLSGIEIMRHLVCRLDAMVQASRDSGKKYTGVQSLGRPMALREATPSEMRGK